MSVSGSNLISFEHSTDYWLMRARENRSKSNYRQVSILLRRAYQQENSTETALKMVENYYEMGCYSAVKRIALTLLKNDPRSAEAYYWLGFAALSEKDEFFADNAFHAAMKFGGDLPLADTVQNLIYDYPWKDYRIQRRGYRSEQLYDLACRQLRNGDVFGAAASLKLAVSRGRSANAEALYGELLLYRQDATKSAVHLRRSLELDNKQHYVWLLLAQAYAALELSDLSQDALNHALRLTETPQEWGMLMWAAWMLHRDQAFKKALKDTLRQHPQSNDYLYVLAALEGNTGHYATALKYLNTILSIDPDDDDARSAIALLGKAPLPFLRQQNHFITVPETMWAPPATDLRDSALRRLVHGQLISLGGTAEYREVLFVTRQIWDQLSPLQRHLCDIQPYWPAAIYQFLCDYYHVTGAPTLPGLWPIKRGKRRIRRMKKYLTKRFKENRLYEIV